MTYDQIQMAAVLIVCAGCQRGYYMTVPAGLCIKCRKASHSSENEPAEVR